MFDHINAEIVAIGTEILLGEITDTNSVYLAQQLRDLGVNVYYMTSVGDNKERIENALRIALGRADVVLTCGGLGPTVDDMTRESVAAATDRELVFHQVLLDQIAARFAMFRAQMTDNNRLQAYLPADAIVVENPVGTAPAFIVEHQGKVVMSLPGVPREMKFLLQEKMIPYLKQRYRLGIIKARNLRVAGIGESALDELIGKELLEGSNPSIGLAAHHGVIDVRITVKAADDAAAEAMLNAHEVLVRERIGEYIFGKDKDTLEATLAQLMQQTGAKLAVIEAGISDAVIDKLEQASGNRTLFTLAQGYAHPTEFYQAMPEVQGLAFRDAAVQTAERICQRSGADAAIVIICDPDVNESADSEGATALAIYTPEKAHSRIYGFGGKAEMTRTWVSRWAMSQVWRSFREKYQA
jgi:nicotinamide-nucleotide amidase